MPDKEEEGDVEEEEEEEEEKEEEEELVVVEEEEEHEEEERLTMDNKNNFGWNKIRCQEEDNMVVIPSGRNTSQLMGEEQAGRLEPGMGMGETRQLLP